jgi:hypothetical protein
MGERLVGIPRYSHDVGTARKGGHILMASHLGPDASGLLRAMVELDGVRNVRGSSSASLAGYGAVSIVFESSLNAWEFEKAAAKRQHDPNERGLDLKIRQLGDIDTQAGSLFEGTLLREVRFEFEPWGDAGGEFDTLPLRVGACLVEFLARLEALELPVAYIHYPHAWSPTASRPATRPKPCLRVCYGVKADSYSSERAVDQAAAVAAGTHGASLSIYLDDSGGNVPFGERFRTFPSEVLAKNASRTKKYETVAVVPGEDQSLHLLQEAGPAQIGYMLSVIVHTDGQPPRIHGISASVICGTSQVMLVEPASDYHRRNIGQGGSSSVSDVGAPILRGLDSGHDTFWIAWESQDRSGVLSTILRTVADYVQDRIPSEQVAEDGPVEPNIEYGVSRVTASRRCVGKLKFSLPAILRVATWPDQETSPDFASELLDVLAGALVDAEFRVTRHEPDMNPWAEMQSGEQMSFALTRDALDVPGGSLDREVLIAR